MNILDSEHRSSWSLWPIGGAFLIVSVQIGLGLMFASSPLASGYLKFCRWDSHWYEKIIRLGYVSTIPPFQKGSPSDVAFFPGYPLLCKALLLIAPWLSIKVALLLVAQASALFFWGLFLKIIWNFRLHPWLKVALTLLAISFPSTFYLVAGYSEPLFLASYLGFLYFYSREKWILAAGLGFVCCATRLFGLLAPASVIIAEAISWDKGDRIPFGERKIIAKLITVGISVLGDGSFFIFCYWKFGVWDLYMQSERIFWNVIPNPFILISRTPWFPRIFHWNSEWREFDPEQFGAFLVPCYSWLLVGLLAIRCIRRKFQGTSGIFGDSLLFSAFSSLFLYLIAKGGSIQFIVRFVISFVYICLLSCIWLKHCPFI